MPLALRPFAQVDECDIGLSEKSEHLGGPPAALGGCSARRFQIRRLATSIIFGLLSLRLFISLILYASHLQPRIVRLLFANRGNGVAFIVMRRIDKRHVR